MLEIALKLAILGFIFTLFAFGFILGWWFTL